MKIRWFRIKLCILVGSVLLTHCGVKEAAYNEEGPVPSYKVDTPDVPGYHFPSEGSKNGYWTEPQGMIFMYPSFEERVNTADSIRGRKVK